MKLLATALFFVLMITLLQISYAKQLIRVKTVDNRSTSFSLYSEQSVRDLKSLIAERFNIPQCNIRLLNKDDDSLDDNMKIKSLGKHAAIKILDVSSPLHPSECQHYDHPPKL